jgi:hypothetical protein
MFGNSCNTISSGLQVILCCLFVCGLFIDTVSSLNCGSTGDRVFENRLLRKIFAAKRKEVKGGLGTTA